MAEILLIYPPDKTSAARQVEAALASAGYRAVLEPVAGPDGEAIGGKASGHEAALLIWSRALAASADLDGWIASLRRLTNLIEVSTDGIAPQSGDERRVVLLSGWRGQPFHLGWQRVLDELESLGTRRAAPVRAALSPTAVPEEKPATDLRPSEAAGSSARGRRLALPAAAVLAALAAVGGAAWIGSNASDPPPSAGRTLFADQAETPPPVAAPPEPAPVAVPDPAPPPPPPPEAPPAPVPARKAAVPPLAKAPTQDSAKSRSTTRPAGPSAKPRPAAAPPLKRYSRKHSKTMRQFCARSGRSTPQCRDFARSTGALRR